MPLQLDQYYTNVARNYDVAADGQFVFIRQIESGLSRSGDSQADTTATR
jgi:hypothetical protein